MTGGDAGSVWMLNRFVFKKEEEYDAEAPSKTFCEQLCKQVEVGISHNTKADRN